jgi:hypothetical protein
MRHLLSFALCLIVGLAAFGCGGGSGSGSGQGSSPFVGSYAGTFINSLGQSGAIALVVSSSGSIAATVVNTTTDTQDSLQGTINNSGLATLNDAIGPVGSGTLKYNQANQLTGPLVNTNANVTTTITVSSTEVVGAVPFAGSFTGTFTIAETQSGTMTLIVTSSGNVTGLMANTTTEASDVLNGTITSQGVVLLNASNGGGTITGTLAINQSDQLAGNLTNQGGTLAVLLNPTSE